MKIIARGAEAVLYKENNSLIKERIKKSYRIPEIDIPLRKIRTRREAKILEKLSFSVAPFMRWIALRENSPSFA